MPGEGLFTPISRPRNGCEQALDQVWMWLDSVWVGPEQAARAQQVLAPPQPGADADAERQSPPPAQMKMREGGMLDVEGDTQAVRQWLEDAGIPGGAMTDGPEGVIVTAGSVERARQALAGHASSVGVVDTLPAEGAPVPFSQVRNGGIDSGPVAGDFSSERGDFHGNASGRASQGVSMGSQELQSKNGAPHAFGRISFQQGARPDANELRAGRSLADLGYNVIHKVTANDLGVPETPTADLEVEGIGQVDVYTPNTSEVKNIVREIERKKEQATSVLVQTDLDDASIQAIQERFWGKPNALRIQSLFFQDSGGIMIYVPRPKKGN